MKNLKLYCEINPFTHLITVSEHLNNTGDSVEIEWNGELDFWQAFNICGQLLDFHLIYEDELEVSIYSVTKAEEEVVYTTDTSCSHTVKTKVKY